MLIETDGIVKEKSVIVVLFMEHAIRTKIGTIIQRIRKKKNWLNSL